jgi:predicted ribosomally synthesized peptide with SipW-like signal peptide
MKRILLSLLIIAGIGGAMVAGTRAFFSDTETSPNNTLAAGTIDISVDGHNPWNETLLTANMDDLKPGMSKTVTFRVGNEGVNALVLWKRVKITNRGQGTQTEPETAAETSLGGPKMDLDSKMHYDLTVGTVNTIPTAWNVMMSDIDQLWIPLGKVEAGAHLSVTQVYKLDDLTGNEYQGDVLTFDIDLYAEQIGAPGPSHTTRGVVLENKDATFSPIMDSTWGLLTFDLTTGAYRLRAWNLTGLQHQLQAWDYATNSDIGYFGPVNAGANLDYIENYVFSAHTATKYWLRETGGAWNNAQTLWESNLVN